MLDGQLRSDETCQGGIAMFRYLFGSMTTLSLMTALMIQSPVRAQEHRDEATGRPQEEVEEVQEDYYEVWGTSTKEPNRDRPWSESFDSEAKAQARLKELERDYAKGGLMESAPDKPTALKIRKLVRTVKRIKKAKDAAQGKAKERKVGDTLREYAKNVEQAYERAKKFKEQRLAATKNLSKQQMDEVNALIKSYNKTRESYGDLSRNAVAPILSKYPAMSLLSDKDQSEPQAGKYTVWVYKMEDEKWAKQEDRTLSTDDEEQARSYVEKVKSYRGWTATSNLPKPKGRDTLAISGTKWIGVYIAPNQENYSSSIVFGQGNSCSVNYNGDADNNATWRIQGDSVIVNSFSDINLKINNGIMIGVSVVPNAPTEKLFWQLKQQE
jgi:hypothetical protein